MIEPGNMLHHSTCLRSYDPFKHKRVLLRPITTELMEQVSRNRFSSCTVNLHHVLWAWRSLACLAILLQPQKHVSSFTLSNSSTLQTHTAYYQPTKRSSEDKYLRLDGQDDVWVPLSLFMSATLIFWRSLTISASVTMRTQQYSVHRQP